MPLQEAYLQVHNPVSLDLKDKASDRVATEEYFALVSAFRIIKGDKQQVRQIKYGVTADDLKKFADGFGFSLTDGQKKAVRQNRRGYVRAVRGARFW